MNNENKWLFGPRNTTNKPTHEMDGTELALNNCFVKNENATYRDYDGEYDARHLIKAIAETLSIHITATSPESFDFMLCDWLEEGTESRTGIVAMLYELMWSKAELYEKLKQYEDAEDVCRAGFR